MLARKHTALAAIIWTMTAAPLWAQSANPEPGASFGDDYAPKPAFPQQTKAPPPATRSRIEVQVVAKGLRQPWSLAFLPGGGMLVTEREGHLRLITGGKMSDPVTGTPG